MYLIAGLGNPGEEYANTRHNAGFQVVDLLSRQLGVSYWKQEGGALTAQAEAGEKKIIFAKPQSYMNTSGGPLKIICAHYDIALDHLVVIHDDLDISSGHIRVKFGGGHAGHNGLRSIDAKLGSTHYYRIRCGIGRPQGHIDTARYVLRSPVKEESDLFQETVFTAAQACLFLLEHGLQETQQKFN